MTAGELSEHAGYLRDAVKVASYEEALVAVLAGRDASVLDLGAGTGLLGLLAARAGARVVYAVDSGPIIGQAAGAAARSALSDRIVHLRGRSTEIDLPEFVDVAVCDQIGGFVHDAGILQAFADVSRRLLAPGGALVPAGFRLFLAPARSSVIREQIDLWRSTPAGFDLTPFAEAAVDTEHAVADDQVLALGEGVEIASIRSDHVAEITGSGTDVATRSGRCDGLVGWFTADMGGGVTMTNRPGDPRRMDRWCTFYPLSHPVSLEQGDVVTIELDLRPLLHAVSWRVTVVSAAGETRTRERHSTLLGRFLSRDDLARAGGAPVRATEAGQAVEQMLMLADGTMTSDEIIAALRARDLLDGSPALESTLRDLLERFTRPVA